MVPSGILLFGDYTSLFFLVIEKYFLKNLFAKLPSAISHFYLLLIVVIGFVIFNADGMGEAIVNLKGMFGLTDAPFTNSETVYYLKSYAFIFILAAIASTPLLKNISEKLAVYAPVEKVLITIKPVVHIVLLLLVTAYLIDGSFNPFIYFRF